MRNLEFEMKDGNLHILDYPTADRVVELENDELVKQLKDMRLHVKDLEDAKMCLEKVNKGYSDIVNIALIRNAIITFYKCFGTSNFRNHRLSIKKIVQSEVEEKERESAKAVFEYYHVLRDKFIVHDESRYAQVLVGGILEAKKERPFVDVVCITGIAEVYLDDEHMKGIESFYRLVCISIQWAKGQMDKLVGEIAKKYNEFLLDDFESLDDLKLNIPEKEDLFKKRY